jgi:DNA polymerase-3 subunit delta
MKITHPNLNSNLHQFQSILVYGSDYGLISQTCEDIIDKLIPGQRSVFNFTSLQYSNIIKNPELLYNELNSLSLTKEQKVIYITEVEKSFPAWLKELLTQINKSTFIIFKALELPPSAAIRKFFETEKNLAIIACYHDSHSLTENIIKTKLKQIGISIDKPILDYLVMNINADRLITLSELDKLILFAQEKGKITLNDIQEIICKSSNLSLDDFCFDILRGHKSNFDLQLHQLLDNKINVITIIRTITRHLQQLLKAKSMIVNNVNVEQAIQKLSPPVFFKYVPVFTYCLKHFSLEQLQQLITTFTKLELLCKTTNTDHAVLFEYVVLNQIMPEFSFS